MTDIAIIDRLRRDLVALRAGIIARLGRKLDGDDIVLLGGVACAIFALDQAAAEAGETADRVADPVSSVG